MKWDALFTESQTHFLSKLGTGSLLGGGGNFSDGGRMGKFLVSGAGTPPSPRREKPAVPPKSVKHFNPPIRLRHPQE